MVDRIHLSVNFFHYRKPIRRNNVNFILIMKCTAYTLSQWCIVLEEAANISLSKAVFLLFCINATELYFNNGNNEIEVQTDRQLIDKFRGSFFTRK